MSIVKTDVPLTAQGCEDTILALVREYPFCRTQVLTTTAFGRRIRSLVIGTGERKVLYTAAHHANEWITALILLQFAQEYARAIAEGGTILERDAVTLASQVTIHMIPMVDPDGVDLVTGAIGSGDLQYEQAKDIAQGFPDIPFPEGWKANLLGVDLNLQYPARWLQAREIKYMQGFDRPAPRDFVGGAPLDQRESRALAAYTEETDPALVLAFHSQGKEIYWQFLDYEVPGAKELGEAFAQVSGYTLTDAPYASSFAGYKDWFIQRFRRPGYTIEVGQGQNPLPLSQFPEIYRDNLGILLLAAENPVKPASQE